jgi:hypothetical protein
MFVIDNGRDLLKVCVFMRDHVDETILEIGAEPVGRAQSFETDYDELIRCAGDADRPAAADDDGYARDLH